MTKRKASVALDTGDESDQSNITQDNNSNSTSATNTTTCTNNNNNQLTQNGSSAAGGGVDGQQQIGDNDGSNQQKSKKERADNWSSAEIQVLHRGIETRRDIFYGPPSQATKKNRELAWDAITKEVNSVSTTPRSLSQVMKKFKNEKCRAKRKFIDAEKDSHNNIVGNNNNGSTDNMRAQNHSNNQQIQPQQQQQQSQSQQQSHHMPSTADSMSSQPSSINVVKLAPQNVAKTMIDLPGHVQQIQMPNDDMVLIVPPEMDGLLSGMNIVSDGTGHHHFQKCTGNGALNSQQHNHHGHAIQAINTGQSLVNSTMGNGMMARTIPAGSMCSLVYSTGGDVCGSESHIAGNVGNQNTLPNNHISVNAQNLLHHRGPVEQSQTQQHQHHNQMHQSHQTHQQQQQQQQTPPQHTHQSHQPAQHQQHHPQQNHLASSTNAIANSGAVESQLKNLLFNLLLKDGPGSMSAMNSNQDYYKQRNDMLAMIASSLSKIESHLSRISKVAGSLFGQGVIGSSIDGANETPSVSLNNPNINSNDASSNSGGITGAGSGSSAISNPSGTEQNC